MMRSDISNQISQELNNTNINLNGKSFNDYKFKEPIKDYSRYLSLRNSTPCQLTEVEISTFLASSEILSFGAGIPSKLFFPIKELEFNFNFLGNEKVRLSKEDLDLVQQYSDSPGLPKLRNWCKSIQQRHHGLCDPNTPGKEWNLLMTPGSQHALDCLVKAFFNRGDTLIVERYTYGGMFAVTQPSGINFAACEMDSKGMIPSELDNLLSNWESTHPDLKFPKLIYMIPHGQNPTGILYDMERKEEIYKIACKFDLLIIEDDPHFFLQLDNEIVNGKRVLNKSFLSIDKEDRVIRLDTFSKFLSSGIRMGFVTTNSKLFGVIAFELNASIFHSSGLTQIALEKLLTNWGDEKFDSHVNFVQEVLIRKRRETIELLEKHLKGQVEYSVPKAGLYFWVKLLGIDCSYEFVRDVLRHHKVIFGLGISSSPNRTIKTPYIRVTFSYLEKEDGEVAFKTLSDCLKDYIKNKKIIKHDEDVTLYNNIS
ncbi:hypothetical protein DDB_G0272014 [Dictyostelium discoideum AX4]|uniref:Aromatic amino acid aminotransferase DDB_G0272014 n=1 Tax=Dictyostelium discoideum TaxID=44689 RepID=AATR1_DICDI|nr:hypothetical protein DDB_G0272014 [Dictyostelium discoideum AX4]Q86AG8.1 RecName: Full=Aromatic amino acid aminotransferase DDB_G0272014 [Dictyostelium discoideum]EAL71441.1 hypothetical protein DDB_G0272014 [Dictyostelium discoideum AX4]|eukprot:XP_645381.1 hypothetical protein DDB_G0272014 [Dictyostelium discoideum AX4]